jgi:hypothetical protein
MAMKPDHSSAARSDERARIDDLAGLPSRVGIGVQRSFLHEELLRGEQGAGLGVVADEVEFYLVGQCGGAPGAADDADFASDEGQFGDVLGEADEIVDVGLSHETSVPKDSAKK